MNKKQIQERENKRQAILHVLNAFPEGTLSVNIAKITGIEINTVKRLLIGLRDKGKVFSRDADVRRHVCIWSINETPPPLIIESSNVPYPDLDKDHQEWLAYKKPIYNPR